MLFPWIGVNFLAVFGYAACGITGHKKLLSPPGVLIPWITTDIYVTTVKKRDKS